jgi:hypothetical protein
VAPPPLSAAGSSTSASGCRAADRRLQLAWAAGAADAVLEAGIADARFDPEVVEAAIRSALAGWAAVTSPDGVGTGLLRLGFPKHCCTRVGPVPGPGWPWLRRVSA